MISNKKKTISVLILFLCTILLISNIQPLVSFIIPTNSEIYTEEELTPPDPLKKGMHISDNIETYRDFQGELFTSMRDKPDMEWTPITKSFDSNDLNNMESYSDCGTDTVGYNLLTKSEEIIPVESFPSESGAEQRTVEPYEGLISEPSLESVIGTDDRTRIYNTEDYPWRTVVKLYITAGDGSGRIGSGMIIDNFHILTAGHCVYNHDHGGWAQSIEVIPGKDDTDWPFHHAWVTYMRSYTGWTNDENHNHDWAMCTLDRNVGMYTGWMGRRTADKSSSIYTGTLNIAGYPGDLDFGENMYYDSDVGTDAKDYTHWYHMDTYGGMSGGPVWQYTSGLRYILSIHAYGTGGSWTDNHGTRLNNDKYDRILSWQGDDSGSEPTDKPDLRDRGAAYRTVSDYDVQAGVDSLTVNCDVENVGTAASGTRTVKFYASTNNIITEYDYYLGSDTVSISAFSYDGTVSWSGLVPNSIPEGDYYIGWIIDAYDTADEFDESNNIAYETPKVHIDGYTPPTGYIEVTVRDADTYGTLSSAYIYVKDSTDTVIDAGYTDVSGFYNVTGLDVGWYYIYISRNGYNDKMVSNYINWRDDDDYYTVSLEPKPIDSGYIEVNVNDVDTTNPIYNAYIKCYNMTSGLLIDTGYTDTSGFYNITGLTTGDWFEVEVQKTGYKPQSKQTYINWNGDDDYMSFNLKEYPRDSGYVEIRTYNATSGLNVSSVYITCENLTSGSLIDSGFTDSNGFINFTGLTTGDTFRFNASKGGFADQSKQTYINWNGDDDYLNFYLSENPPDSAYIEVTVLDSDTYLAISSAYVECFNSTNDRVFSGWTTGDGKITVTGLTIGWYTIQVSRVGYKPQNKTNYINWKGDDDYLTFYLEEYPPNSGYIELTVLDYDSSAPISNAIVNVYYNNGTFFKAGITDGFGFYNITGLSIGNWDLDISKVGYKSSTVSNYINWNGDDDYKTVYLQSYPLDSGYIEISVLDSMGIDPIDGALIKCLNSTSGALIDSGNTDSSGFYNITDLYVGSYNITVSKQYFKKQTKLDTINWAGDDDYLTFNLELSINYVDGKIAIFQDSYSWGKNVTEPILIKHNISYNIFSSMDFGAVDLTPYDKVIISSYQPQQFYNRLVGNVSWFENYANNGGILEVHACDSNSGSSWFGLLLMPGGLNKSQTYTNNVTISILNHPILNSPYPVEDAELDNWGWSTHGYFSKYPISTRKILLDSNNSSKPVLIEFPYGAGQIIASMQTLEWNEYYNDTRILENMILYAGADYDPPVSDISYSSIVSPNFIIPSTPFSLSADDGEGIGLQNITYSIDGGAWTLYSGSFTLGALAEGLHTIEYFATDINGNEESINSEDVYLDVTAPSSTIAFTPIAGINIVNTTTQFTITADDGSGSGVDIIEYRIDDGAWTTYSGPFTLNSLPSGNYTIEYRSKDNVENLESINSIEVSLEGGDGSPPSRIIGFPIALLLIVSSISLAFIFIKYRKRT